MEDNYITVRIHTGQLVELIKEDELPRLVISPEDYQKHADKEYFKNVTRYIDHI